MIEQKERLRYLNDYLDTAIEASNLYLASYNKESDAEKLEVMLYHKKVLEEIEFMLNG